MKKEKDIPEYRLYPSKVRRMAIQMEKNGDKWDEVLQFISSAYGILDKDKAKIGDWFCENISELYKNKSEDDIKAIMEKCACCLGGQRKAIAAEIKNSNDTYEKRLEALAKTPHILGHDLDIVDNKTFRVNYFPEGWDFYRCPCLQIRKRHSS